MCRMLLSEIHETEALSPKSSSAATITLLNQKDPSSSSTISVICLVISVLALIIVFLGIIHLIFKFLRKSPTLFQFRDFDSNSNSDLSSFSSPQLQHLFVLHDSGLGQTAIDALPVFLYGDVTMSLKEPFDCAVCLSEFSDSDKLRLLPVCSHAFHLHCIDTWLLSNSNCPLCRRSLSASNDAETRIFPLSDHQHVDEGKASLSKRVFSVRLGRFRSTNEGQSQRYEVKGEIGVGVPRRCYSMGTRKYLECDQDFVVSLSSREGKTSNNCSGHEGKSVKQDSGGGGGGGGSRKESMSVSKIWLWSDEKKRVF